MVVLERAAPLVCFCGAAPEGGADTPAPLGYGSAEVDAWLACALRSICALRSWSASFLRRT